MKRTAIVLLILAVVTLLLGCSADDIMNSGKTLQKLQGVNASYVSGQKLEDAKDAVATAIEVIVGEEKIILPPIDDTPLKDKDAIIELRSSLATLVETVRAASESGVSREKLKTLFAEKVKDNEGAWDEEHQYYDFSKGKFCVITKNMIGCFVQLDFDVVFAREQDYVSSLLVYGINVYSASSVQKLISGGSGAELPESIKELQKIVVDKVFKVSETHLREGYMTYGDIVFTAIISDIFASAVDIAKSYETIDETVLEAPEIGTILAYFDIIEFLYDVDLNIYQRIADFI